MPALEGQHRVLLLTNSEYGQANTFIALTSALAVLPNVHVHFGSFADCAGRIVKLRDTLIANGMLGGGSAITFHDIGGPSMEQASLQLQGGTFVHPPGFFGAIKSYHILPETVLNWNGEQYITGVDGCIRIINEVDPHAIAVDNLLNQGYDACIKLGRKHLATGPFSLKDICVQEQSRYILNYPALSSGYPFPLPWSKVLPNFALQIYSIYNFVISPHLRVIGAARKTTGLSGPLPIFRGFRKDIEYLAAMIPELDFHLSNIPSNITLCGPFVLPVFSTVEQTDPELAQWLSIGNGCTILINLGTHAVSDPGMVEQLAKGISVAIQHERDQGRKIHVLWKLKGMDDVDAVLQKELGNEMQAGRVRVVNWLTVDPLALLKEGSVMCSVHHGGANSFFESAISGIPQIILPQWYDLYDYAGRVEYLGIGIYANKLVAPSVDTAEFGAALIEVLKPGSVYTQKAQALRKLCEEKCGGRDMGARRLWEVADEEMVCRAKRNDVGRVVGGN